MSTETKPSATSGQFGYSSQSSSPHSQDFSGVDLDGCLPAPELPENLDDLATFVERASLANSRGQQWNQQELAFLSNMQKDHVHINRPQSCREFHPASSVLPPASREQHSRPIPRSYADLEYDERLRPRSKGFNVDELV